jgi:hypothetical protein
MSKKLCEIAENQNSYNRILKKSAKSEPTTNAEQSKRKEKPDKKKLTKEEIKRGFCSCGGCIFPLKPGYKCGDCRKTGG